MHGRFKNINRDLARCYICTLTPWNAVHGCLPREWALARDTVCCTSSRILFFRIREKTIPVPYQVHVHTPYVTSKTWEWPGDEVIIINFGTRLGLSTYMYIYSGLIHGLFLSGTYKIKRERAWGWDYRYSTDSTSVINERIFVTS